MCIICVDFDKGRMTTAEARRALGEMVVKLDPEHVAQIERTLHDADAGNAGNAASGGGSTAPHGPAGKKP